MDAGSAAHRSAPTGAGVWTPRLRRLSRLRAPDCSPAAGDRGLRVLQLTNMYPSPAQPNRGTFVRSQVESLAGLGLHCEVEEVQGYLSTANYLRALPLLPLRARAGHYDLVHLHFGYTALAAVGVRGLPMVLSFCGDDVLGRPDEAGSRSRKSLALAALCRAAARRMDAVIVKSAEMAAAVGDGWRDLEVIPNGIDLAFFAPRDRAAARAALGWPQDEQIVLFPANPLEPRKNFALARAVVDALRAEGRALRLESMFGRPQADIVTGMAAADLMLSCSVQEGSPNAVKEAMAMNLPVVASDVGDCAERLAGCRLSVAVPLTLPDFIAASRRVLDHGGARCDGRDHVQNLSLEAIARRVLAVYERVLSRRGARAT